MKLNTKSRKTGLTTHEGAPAKRITAAQELRRSVMSCLLWEDEFYEDGESVADRIAAMVSKAGPKMGVDNLAIEARTDMKLRHVPLLIVREMARNPKLAHLVAKTLATVIQRPDELTEFLAIYWKDKKQPLSAQVKKGLAAAFTKFNAHQLAKYNRDGAVKLRDVLFLCHAKPRDAFQANTWNQLVNNTLPVPDTWETELSAGKEPKATWIRLIDEGKLGGLAMLRNLRNMQEVSVPDTVIRRGLTEMNTSMVLPFRFIAAARYAPRFEPELEKAMFKSIVGLPKLVGHTIVLVDVSGSMSGHLSGKSDMRRLDAAYGVAMVARELCETCSVYSFSNTLVEVPARRGFALRDALDASQAHRSTELGPAVSLLNSQVDYDRIIVITDEQSSSPVPGPKHVGYMINVASARNGVGYGPWVHIDGFSENVIRYIAGYEACEQ